MGEPTDQFSSDWQEDFFIRAENWGFPELEELREMAAVLKPAEGFVSLPPTNENIRTFALYLFTQHQIAFKEGSDMDENDVGQEIIDEHENVYYLGLHENLRLLNGMLDHIDLEAEDSEITLRTLALFHLREELNSDMIGDRDDPIREQVRRDASNKILNLLDAYIDIQGLENVHPQIILEWCHSTSHILSFRRIGTEEFQESVGLGPVTIEELDKLQEILTRMSFVPESALVHPLDDHIVGQTEDALLVSVMTLLKQGVSLPGRYVDVLETIVERSRDLFWWELVDQLGFVHYYLSGLEGKDAAHHRAKARFYYLSLLGSGRRIWHDTDFESMVEDGERFQQSEKEHPIGGGILREILDLLEIIEEDSASDESHKGK